MKTPGSDHPIAYAPKPGRLRAKIGDSIIADTNAAIEVREGSYPAVIYFPRADVETGYFSATSKVTHCPYKGDATHYTVLIDSTVHENAAWSYEAPFPSAEAIQGLIAFYPKDVEVYAVTDEQLAARRID